MAFRVAVGTGAGLEAKQTSSISTLHFSLKFWATGLCLCSFAEISAKACKKDFSFVAAVYADNCAESWKLLSGNRPHKGNTSTD